MKGRWLYLLSLLTLPVLQTFASGHNPNSPECRRCTINAKCNSQDRCECKTNFNGDPLFHCHHPSTWFCRMNNDPGIQTFSGERIIVDTVGSSLVADLTSDRTAMYDGKCHIKLYEWTTRYRGKIYVEGIQFQLRYQDSLGQTDSLEARIKASVNKPVFSMDTPQACTKGFADIIFIMDSSGSIGRSDYDIQRKFVAAVTRSFEIGARKVRFGLVIYSTIVQVRFNLNRFSDADSLVAEIENVRYLSGLTRTDLALAAVVDKRLFSSSNGGRDEASKLVIVLTDGLSTRPSVTTLRAQRLKATGVRVIAIGIGNADGRELRRIASTDSDVFKAPNFSVLDNITMDLVHRTCGDICVGTYTWKIGVKRERQIDFRHVRTITSQGSPNATKFIINNFGCLIEFKRIEAMFLMVDFQCCGVRAAIRAFNSCDMKKTPGIWIQVKKRNNPQYFWDYTVPLCLDDGNFTIASVTNYTGLHAPRVAHSFLSLINGGPTDYHNAPAALEELGNTLRACRVAQLKNFFDHAGFMMTFPPLINCVSNSPGQEDIAYLLLRTAEYFCQRLIQGCKEAKQIINGKCSDKVIDKNQVVRAFLDAPCVP